MNPRSAARSRSLRTLLLLAACGLAGACSTGTLGDGVALPLPGPDGSVLGPDGGDTGGDTGGSAGGPDAAVGTDPAPGPGPGTPTGPIGDGIDSDGGHDGASLPPDVPGPDAGPAPVDPPGQSCPAGMVTFDGFCMDRYEAPNEAGALPLAMSNALDGEAWCAERGKRLCSEAEWVRACQGPTGRAYPYGASYQRSTCNDDKVWRSPGWSTLATWPSPAAMAEAERLYQGDPSGSREGCVSEEGVHDLTGNVAEWVRRSFNNANNYDHVLKGCYWAGCYGGAPPSCGFVNGAHPSGFRTYEAGFRCCLDHDEATP